MYSYKNNIVIIGATGLIGQHLVKRLSGAGYKPIVLTRNPEKAEKIFSSEVITQYWDGVDVPTLTNIINGVIGVVNLSGESIVGRWTNKKKETILRSRLNTTNALVHSIKACIVPPAVYVQASAVGYYPHNSTTQFDENGRLGEGFLSQVVFQWEKAAFKVEDNSRLVVIRTGVVLSASGGFLEKITTPMKLGLGGWFGRGQQMLSWMHIDDHVKAIQFLIENSKSKGIYNLVSLEPKTYKEFAKGVGKRLNRPVWLSIPPIILKLFYGQMVDEVILSSQNVVPERLLTEGFQFKYSRLDTTLNDLLK